MVEYLAASWVPSVASWVPSKLWLNHLLFEKDTQDAIGPSLSSNQMASWVPSGSKNFGKVPVNYG